MLRNAFNDALRYWEPRRLAYNVALAILTSAWVLLTWPHFQPALKLPSLSKLLVLVALANLCYCAAYLVDVPLQHSSFGITWRRRRWVLWLVGTCFALLITYYWIADEIYPFVGPA
jgi:hypothetical protein